MFKIHGEFHFSAYLRDIFLHQKLLRLSRAALECQKTVKVCKLKAKVLNKFVYLLLESRKNVLISFAQIDDTSLMKHFFNTDLSNILNFFYFISNENKWNEEKKYKNTTKWNEIRLCWFDKWAFTINKPPKKINHNLQKLNWETKTEIGRKNRLI